MNRRRYLASTAGVAGVSLAGHAALTGETDLGTPTERRDGQSVHFVYERDGEEVTLVYFDESTKTPALRRLRVYVEQPGDTVLDHYRFRFRSDPESEGSADIYPRPPGSGTADAFDAYRDDDRTVVEVTEFDEEGRGTAGFDLLIHCALDDDGGPPPIAVDYELTLSEDGVLGDTFVARDRATVALANLEETG